MRCPLQYRALLVQLSVSRSRTDRVSAEPRPVRSQHRWHPDIDQTGLIDIAVDDLGAQFYCRQQSSELTGSLRELVLLFDNKFT